MGMLFVGVDSATSPTEDYVGSDAQGYRYGYYGVDGTKIAGGVAQAMGSAYSAGDLVQVAVCMNTGKVWFGLNDQWVGNLPGVMQEA